MPATHDVYAPTSLHRPPARWVRCLGPCETEHSFLPPDPATERICGKCRRKQPELAACETKASVTEGVYQ